MCMGVYGCVRQCVSEGVSVRRLPLNMQLRAGGDIVCVGPPCWCRSVQSRPRPHCQKRKPTRALAVSASCGFPIMSALWRGSLSLPVVRYPTQALWPWPWPWPVGNE